MVHVDNVSVVWLSSFVAVVDSGSFTAAAATLHRTQPRVSSHIASLERELGAQVLDRTSRGVSVTAAGRALLPHARAVLREMQSGVDSVATSSTDLRGRLRIGCYPGAMAVLVIPLVRRFIASHPDVQVELREDNGGDLEDAVDTGRVDLAFRSADMPQRRHGIPSLPLFVERLTLLVPHGHPLAGGSNPDMSLLSSEAVAVTGLPSRGWTDYSDLLDRAGIVPREIITVIQPTTIVALAREGLAIGLLGSLAASIAAAPGDVVRRALPQMDWHREVRLYRAPNAMPSKVESAFIELIREEGPSLSVGLAIWP